MRPSEKKLEVEIRRGQIPARRTHQRAFCPLCRQPTNLVTFGQAANFCRGSQVELSRLFDRGAIHRIHNARGVIMVCFDSLQAAAIHLQETRPLGFDTLRDVDPTTG